MKNRVIIIVSVLVVAILGIMLIGRAFSIKKPVKQPVKVAKKAPIPATPIKKQLSKDMGGLTVKTLNSKGKEAVLRIRAFRATDSKSSTYASSFTSNRMQELLPGSYDIELDTVPQKIYKNIKVAKGQELTEDLGAVTGAVSVKALNSQKKEANYPVRIVSAKSGDILIATSTNKAIDIVPGLYDVEIGTAPKQVKKDVRVEASKEVNIDLGCTTGTLLVKAVDENGKEARYSVRIAKAENNEVVVTGITNRPIEIVQGLYNIEVQSRPAQTKKDALVNAGEEQSAEFIVQTPPPPAPRMGAQAPKRAKR